MQYHKIKNYKFLFLFFFLFFFSSLFAQEKTDSIPFILTQSEKDWVEAHPIVKVGVDRDYAPYEWLEYNEYKGFVVEYMERIEKVIGIEFQIVENKSWDEILNLAKDGKIDLITGVTNTPKRSEYLNFTQHYRSNPIIIVDNGKNGFAAGLKYLNNKTVSIEENYFMEEILKDNYPNIKLEVVKSTKKALELANLGKVDAYVGDVGLVDYIIKNNKFTNLRFSGQTQYSSDQSFAVLKENTELFNILNKAVKSLPEDEIESMFNHWLNVERGIDIKTMSFYIFGLCVVLMIGSYWVYRLKSEIKQRKIIEEKLKATKLLYKELIEDINDVIWKVNTEFVFTYISPSDERFRGYKASEVVGKNIFEIFTDESIILLKKEIMKRQELAKQGIQLAPMTIELQHKCKDGSLIWGEIISNQELDLDGNVIGYHGITREITQRKEVQEEIQQFAFTDTLTKLPNRRSLESQMSLIMAKSQRSEKYCALVFVDLDNFKPLNDNYGHSVGDLLLIEVANRLEHSVRKCDVVSRLGGDEFVLILDELDQNKVFSKENVFEIVEKIRINISKPYKFNIIDEENKDISIEHYCTASIGVCMFKGEEESSLNIFKRADLAMYQAKDAGRNTIKFYK